MPTLNYSGSVSGLGGSISFQIPRTADGGGNREIAVPHGFAGQLTTRTDNETGTLTMSPGHGITTGAIIDLYWATGARYGITVGTVATNSVPIGADNSGTGDNLPTASPATAIVASLRVEFNADVDGPNVALLAMQQVYANATETAQSHIVMLDDSDAEVGVLPLPPNTALTFDIAGGGHNPVDGDPIVKCFVSNGSATNDATFKMLWVQDVTP